MSAETENLLLLELLRKINDNIEDVASKVETLRTKVEALTMSETDQTKRIEVLESQGREILERLTAIENKKGDNDGNLTAEEGLKFIERLTNALFGFVERHPKITMGLVALALAQLGVTGKDALEYALKIAQSAPLP